MKNVLNNLVSSELLFVYSLIILVVIFIMIILIIDRKQSKKKPQNIFDTLNMKIIEDAQEEQETIIEKKEEEVTKIDETVQKIEEYVESNLEKTQAQIRVEEIKKALEEAQVEEQIQEDKFDKFEKEQEQNAIISYHELKKSFDQLYQENEKNQYLEDDQIPINIQELYDLKKEETEVLEEEKEETKKVVIQDLTDILPKKESKSTFKSSPYISPVYGIQQSTLEEKKVNQELEHANDFLNNLKELKNNLD